MGMFDGVDVNALLPSPEEEEQKRQLRLSQMYAGERSPAQAAKDYAIARDQGVPVGAQENAPAPAPRVSWSELTKTSPILAKTLSDPALAAGLQGDVETMSRAEKLFGGWRDIAWSTVTEAKRGWQTSELGKLYWKQKSGQATAADLNRIAALEKESESEPMLKLGLLSGVLPMTVQSLALMARSAVDNASTITQSGLAGGVAGAASAGAAGAAVTAPVGGAGALLTAPPGFVTGVVAGSLSALTVTQAIDNGITEGGLAYGEYLKLPNVDPEMAKVAADFVAVANGGLELIPLTKVLKVAPWASKYLKPGSRDLMRKVFSSPTRRAAFARFAARVVESGMFEAITEGAQEFNTIFGGLMADGSNRTVTDALHEALYGVDPKTGQPYTERVGESAVGGAQGGLGMGLGPNLLELHRDTYEAKLAAKYQKFWSDLALTQTDIITRDDLGPEHAQHINELQQAYGVVETVSAPAEKLRDVFKANGLEDADIERLMPEVFRQMQTADEVAIPVSDFATYIAPLKEFSSLQLDLRVGDGITIREAEQAKKDAPAVATEFKAAKETGRALTPKEQVYEDVFNKRMSVGAAESQASQEAALWAAFAESRANRGAAPDAAAYYAKQRIEISHDDISTALAKLIEDVKKNPNDPELQSRLARLSITADLSTLDHADPGEVEVTQLGDRSVRFTSPESPISLTATIEDGHLVVDALAIPNDLYKQEGWEKSIGGKGYSTALYIRALKYAQANGLGWRSDMVRTDPTEKMYGRLQRNGLGIASAITETPGIGGQYEMTPKQVKKAKLDRVWGSVLEEAAAQNTLNQRQDALPGAIEFYSAVARVVEAAKQEKGDAKSWLSIIQGKPGVKKEELNLIGLKAWLERVDKLKGRQLSDLSEYELSDVLDAMNEFVPPSPEPTPGKPAIPLVSPEDRQNFLDLSSYAYADMTPAQRKLVDTVNALDQELADRLEVHVDQVQTYWQVRQEKKPDSELSGFERRAMEDVGPKLTDKALAEVPAVGPSPEAAKFMAQKFKGTIVKAAVLARIKAGQEMARAEELVLGDPKVPGQSIDPTITDEERTDIEGACDDAGVGYHENSEGRWKFRYTSTSYEASTDLDSIIAYVRDSEGSRTANKLKEASTYIDRLLNDPDDLLESGIEDWEQDNPVPQLSDFEEGGDKWEEGIAASDAYSDAKERWQNERTDYIASETQSLLENYVTEFNEAGRDIDVSVEVRRGNAYYSGTAEAEVDLTDPDEIVDKVRDDRGRSEANALEEAFKLLSDRGLMRGSTSTSSQNTPAPKWKQYTLTNEKNSDAMVAGSYRNVLFMNPPERAPNAPFAYTYTGHWEAAYSKGLIGHVRFSIHLIDGKKVLFVDEVQADRLQAARKLFRKAREQAVKAQTRVDELTLDRDAAKGVADRWAAASVEGSPEQSVEVLLLRNDIAGMGYAVPTDADLKQRIENLSEQAQQKLGDAEKDLALGKEKVASLKKKTGYDSVAAAEKRIEVKVNLGNGSAEVRDPAYDRKMSIRKHHLEKEGIDAFTEETVRKYAAEKFVIEAFEQGEAIPDNAAIQESFDEFAAKWVVARAIKEGAEGIAWTTGEQQIDRWESALSQHFDKVVATFTPGTDNGTVQGMDASGNDVGQEHAFTGEEGLAAVMGGDLAARMFKLREEGKPTILAGSRGEFRMGGEGIRMSYDKAFGQTLAAIVGAGVKPALLPHTGMEEDKGGKRQPPLVLATLNDDERAAYTRQLTRQLQGELARAEALAELNKIWQRPSITTAGEFAHEVRPLIPALEQAVADAEGEKTLEAMNLDLFARTPEEKSAAYERAVTKYHLAKIRLEEYEKVAGDHPQTPDDANTDVLDRAPLYIAALKKGTPVEDILADARSIPVADLKVDDLDRFEKTFGVDGLRPFFMAVALAEKYVKVWQLPLPKEAQERIQQTGIPYYQKTGKGNVRGSITFTDVRDWFRITLTGKANLSTFLHESGHAFMEMMRRDAMAGHVATQQDLAVLDSWLDHRPGEDYTVEQLEQFARGFEAYLREGKAPSAGLETAFEAFKSWLRYVYRHLFQLDVELTDEVRQVMDRMVATDDEIATQVKRTNLLPMLGPTNMTPAEYATYKDRFERGLKEARSRMERDAIAELRRAVSEDGDRVRFEVTQEVDARPVQKLILFLAKGIGLEGAAEDFTGKKLDRTAVKDSGVPLGHRTKLLTEENGIHPDTLAPYFGFASGSDLLAALAGEPARRVAISQEFEARMSEKYPGYGASPAWMEEKALTELHSNEVGVALLTELEAIGKQVGAEKPKSALAAIKLAAKRALEEMTVLELTPGRFLRAEADAAKLAQVAFGKKDFTEAYHQKRRQLWNREMWRLVAAAKTEAEKAQKYLISFEDVATRRRIGLAGQTYLETIDSILEGVDLKKRSKKELDRRASYLVHLNKLREQGEPIVIPDDLPLKNWRTLSLTELRGVRDAVESLHALANLKNKIRIGRELRDFKRTVAEMAAHIEAKAGVNFNHKAGTPTWWEKKKEWLEKAGAHLKKVEFFCREMDGGQTAGFIHSLLFQPLVDAQTAKADLSATVLAELKRPFDELTLKERLRYDQRVDFLGHSLLLRDVLAVALNLGNEGNKERLLTGYGWTEAQVTQRLGELLNDHDLDLVEHIWRTIDSLWPLIKGLSERTVGLAPERVEATVVRIGKRELAGGYYPIVKDPKASTIGLKVAERKTGDVFENSFMGPLIEMGFTKQRGQDMSPLLLSIDVVPSHINEVIHYITHYEAVRAVDRLTQNTEVKNAIQGALGHEAWKQFRPWLQAIAADGNIHQNTGFIESALRHLRFGSSIMLLGGKVTTAVMQGFGVFPAIKETSIRHVVSGIGAFMKQVGTGNPFTEVEKLSSELRLIDKQVDRDVSQFFEQMTSAFSEYGHLKEKLAHFSLGMMMLVQKSVNTITWYAAREQAMEEGHGNPGAYADSVVRLSQAGGGIINTAAVQRVSEGARIWVVMYTYFSVLYNQLAERTTSKTAPGKAGELASRWFWLVTLPVVCETLLKGRQPDRDRDKESWLRYLAIEQALYASRTIPVAGALVEGFLNEREARVAPWVSAMLRGAVLAGKASDGLTEGERKRLLVDSLGTLTQTPTTAAWNAYQYLDAFTSGRLEEPIQDLLFRSKREWK